MIQIGKAQYVTIPDTVFVNWLRGNGFASCMNGNQLDTTCQAVLQAISLSPFGIPIRDLTGVQYFKNATDLDCSNDSLTYIPSFPPMLINIKCSINLLRKLPALPGNLQSLICDINRLDSLPVFPNSLAYLDCGQNKITSIPALPPSMWELSCGHNLIDSLPSLPASLRVLIFEYNNVHHLPILPTSLNNLSCNNNPIGALPNTLPPHLFDLNCSSDSITILPSLPLTLSYFVCNRNNISYIPTLPPLLTELSCSHTLVTTLPLLPHTLATLFCNYCRLTTLPALPDTMVFLMCDHNPGLTCLPQLKKISDLDFSNTAVTCLPNYGSIANSNPLLSTVPLCSAYNPGNCYIYGNINGLAYYDANSNCQNDSNDAGTNYTKIQLYNSGNLVQQTYSGGEGYYSFRATSGYYSLIPDTSNLPLTLQCPSTGILLDTLTAQDSVKYNQNFAFKCRTAGYDLGVHSILNGYVIPRPGTVFSLKTVAGDLTELYGAHCATGISGQVQLTALGPVTFLNIASGSLSPSSASNNTITWNVADFSAVNIFSAFNTVFQIDSTATVGSSICFKVSITPGANDFNHSNNSLIFCFDVANALDPNEKEVTPESIDSAGQWLTYTIRFQNTGNAPALNIVVKDTLSNKLDPSTFTLLAYSHENVTQIAGNIVTFNFPNINLADSNSNEPASHGYVQFQIKTAGNIVPGDVVSNNASIYFDLNSPVVTNTANSVYTFTTGIVQQVSASNITVKAYPNPFSQQTNIEVAGINGKYSFELYDLTGRVQTSMPSITSNKLQITRGNLAAGVYTYRITTSDAQVVFGKLVVE